MNYIDILIYEARIVLKSLNNVFRKRNHCQICDLPVPNLPYFTLHGVRENLNKNQNFGAHEREVHILFIGCSILLIFQHFVRKMLTQNKAICTFPYNFLDFFPSTMNE